MDTAIFQVSVCLLQHLVRLIDVCVCVCHLGWKEKAQEQEARLRGVGERHRQPRQRRRRRQPAARRATTAAIGECHCYFLLIEPIH